MELTDDMVREATVARERTTGRAETRQPQTWRGTLIVSDVPLSVGEVFQYKGRSYRVQKVEVVRQVTQRKITFVEEVP